MIARVWHGWTAPEQADAYETLLKTEIFPGIFAKKIAGFEHVELFRRPAGSEVEFMTVMWFESEDAIAAFTGADREVAYVPDNARKVLAHFDARAKHYEVRAERDALPAGSFTGT